MPLYQNSFPSLLCVCVCFSKKKIGNCLTLFKRVCYVQYNLSHPLLKVTMTFKWSYGVPLCQNLFSSPLCVCVCFKKKIHGLNLRNFNSLLYIIYKGFVHWMTTLNTSRSAQIHHEVRNQDIEYIMKCALLDVFNVDIQDTNLASNNKKIKKNWKRK